MPGQIQRNTLDIPFGIYAYCFTQTPVSFPHTLMGIDDEHEVYAIERNGLFAIVSALSLKEFSEDALDKKMTDMVWIASKAKKHEEVIEFVMTYTSKGCHEPLYRFSQSTFNKGEPEGILKKEDEGEERENPQRTGVLTGCYSIPVVPLRFCTIYKNQETLFQTILPHKEKIIKFLNYTTDKTEWSVKIFGDKKVFMDRYDQRKGQPIKIDQTSLLPGEGYLLAKKKHKICEEALRVEIQRILQDIYSTVLPYTDGCRFLRCFDKKIHGRSSDMVMNAAFLIKQQMLVSFRDSMNIQGEKYKNEGLVFELTGPWPPYSFCPEL
ncbi:MAG: GvpL/GvpF family gas vesicle protein [Candidatus Jettenia caeni]|nr:MAG: GvpL/GvpF family gas vesicle protein [Candidatus Jettenia caeni]